MINQPQTLMDRVLFVLPVIGAFVIGACTNDPTSTTVATAEPTDMIAMAEPTETQLLQTGKITTQPIPTPTASPLVPGGIVNRTPEPELPDDLAGEVWEPSCPAGMTLIPLYEYGPNQKGEFVNDYRCEQQVTCDSPQFAQEVSSAGVDKNFIDQGKSVYTFWLECEVNNLHDIP